MKEIAITLYWFRRDLRIDDNHALFEALRAGLPVLPIYIFEPEYISKIPFNSNRVSFIEKQINNLNGLLLPYNSQIDIFEGDALEIFKVLFSVYNIKSVFINEEYEPNTLNRDNNIEAFCKAQGADFFQFKDHVFFHKNEITKPDGSPYTVFTPYSKKWLERLKNTVIPQFSSEAFLSNFIKQKDKKTMLQFQKKNYGVATDIFKYQTIELPTVEFLEKYETTRNIPSIEAETNKMSTYLRYGFVSIRKLVQKALIHSSVYLNELIWRDFFSQILFHFPHSQKECFKKQYSALAWSNDQNLFEKWCNAQTGFPFVDAGMQELNTTGLMHNRLRMVTAGFLCKNLLIDWRWGETYFAQKLLDYDMASNVGNWQWAAGTGCDAAPYFRIFNPITQQKKFDPENLYTNKQLKNTDTSNTNPIVDLSESRAKAIAAYKKALMK